VFIFQVIFPQSFFLLADICKKKNLQCSTVIKIVFITSKRLKSLESTGAEAR
jgi:hypothetical protein